MYEGDNEVLITFVDNTFVYICCDEDDGGLRTERTAEYVSSDILAKLGIVDLVKQQAEAAKAKLEHDKYQEAFERKELLRLQLKYGAEEVKT